MSGPQAFAAVGQIRGAPGPQGVVVPDEDDPAAQKGGKGKGRGKGKRRGKKDTPGQDDSGQGPADSRGRGEKTKTPVNPITKAKAKLREAATKSLENTVWLSLIANAKEADLLPDQMIICLLRIV